MKINKELLMALIYTAVAAICVMFLYSTPSSNVFTIDVITLLFVTILGGYYFLDKAESINTSEKEKETK